MNKNLGKLLIAVVLVSLFATTMAPSANAGINGQQLSIRFKSLDCVLKWKVTVRGYNQNGVYTAWSTTQVPKMVNLSTCKIDTTNVWWEGKAYVYASTPYSSPYSKVVNVPTFQFPSNWYTVNLP